MRNAQMDRREFLAGSAASAAAIWSGEAAAQDAFPVRPITIINAFPPGGANDLVTRPAASALEAVLKQPVVVETKAGAAGAVGAQVAASAKPTPACCFWVSGVGLVVTDGIIRVSLQPTRRGRHLPHRWLPWKSTAIGHEPARRAGRNTRPRSV